MAESITKLLRNDVIFLWEDRQNQALKKLKHEIVSAKPLAVSDFTKNFKLQTNASNISIAAVLLQELDGQLTSIYCVTHADQMGKKYSTTKCEALAVIFALK